MGLPRSTFYDVPATSADVRECEALEWEELPNRRDCRISAYLNDVDPEDEKDWRRQHEWLASRLNDMHRVFAGRVRTLNADSWRGDGGPDATVPGSSTLDVAS